MLHLYCARVGEQGKDLPLSDYRKERLAGIHKEQLRRQMLTAELLLNRAVQNVYPQALLPLQIEKGRDGKPYLTDLPLFFSLSHSGDFVACAIADFEIGLDIQCIRPVSIPLVHRFFSEAELSRLQKSEHPDELFSLFWSLRESYWKATGRGLTGGLNVAVYENENGFGISGFPDIRFWTEIENAFVLALCTLNGQEPKPDRIEVNV